MNLKLLYSIILYKMASKYGETHDIFNTHHTQTKAKLDALLAKNTEIEVNNDGVEALLGTGNSSLSSMDGKITACDTGAVVVSSSALPSGASSESSLAAMSAKITACDTGAVVVSSSALPSGAASESSLAGMSTKITACNTGAVVVSSSALPSGAASESSLASVDGKMVACDTGAVVVSSSALPSGAADSAKQDEIKTLITATNTALAGTLTVSAGAPSLSKSSSSPLSAQAINGQSVHTSSEVDVSAARHISLIGSSSDTANSHEVDLLVSPTSGGTFFKTSHSGYFMDGEFHMLVANMPYKYVKVSVKNGDSAVGNSADFTVHLLTSN